jgi:aryl-alcohol dehydrogenase-like predicted oxidoreductase
MAPSYLADQIERSRANLSVATIDVYYLHNPEQQLDAVPPEQFAERLRLAFELFERQCEAGAIGSYGCATWSGLLTPPDAKGHLSLAALVATARELAGDAHHFRVVQLPVNLMRSDAARAPTQRLDDGRMVTMLEAASELGIAVIASASLGHAQLAADLPPQIREALPGYASDAQRAIAFVRSLPVISSALVGMKSLSHLRENLGAGRESRATRA